MSDNGNINAVTINRTTIVIVVTLAVASIGWGAGMYKSHDDRIRQLEITGAATNQKLDFIMRQNDELSNQIRQLRQMKRD